MNSKSSSEKKRVAHIGNLANTCLQGESKLPPDDYVYSILENMNATLNNSEKKVVTYQQLQDFRSGKGRTPPDIYPELSNSSGNGQNESSYSIMQRRKILPPKVYPLMAKCQRNLKYLKHNRCIPKQRAHLGFDLNQKTDRTTPKSPLKISYLNNISKKDQSTKVKSNKSKISKEGKPKVSSSSCNKELEKFTPRLKLSDLFEKEFENETLNTIPNKVKEKLNSKKHKKPKGEGSDFVNNSTKNLVKIAPSREESESKGEGSDFEGNSNKNLEKITPSKEESDMESDDNFEHFIRKHNRQKKKKRIPSFSLDSSDDSSSRKKKKVKNSKKSVSSRKQDEATTSIEGSASTLKAKNSYKHKKTNLKNKTKVNVPLNSSEGAKSSDELQDDVCSTVEDWTDNSVNDFDAFCHDDSTDSFDLPINDLNTANTETAAITNDSKFSQLFENTEKGGLSDTNIESMQTNLANMCNLESQNIENQKLLLIDVPCSVRLEHLPSSEIDSTSVDISCEATENLPKKVTELNVNRRSSVKSCLPIQTESKNKSNISSESDNEDCLILDVQKENLSDKNGCVQKPESSQESLIEKNSLLSNSQEQNNPSVSNESNTDVIIQNSSGEFNVKILSVCSLGESNSLSDSSDKNRKEQLCEIISEPTIKLEDSDVEIIDLDLLQTSSKDNAHLFKQIEGTMSCDQAIKSSENVHKMKHSLPLQSTCSPTSENNNVLYSNCDNVTSQNNKLQRNAEQSNVQELKNSTKKSNNKDFNQDPKLNPSSVVERNNVLGKHSMSDCIIIDESPLPSNLTGNNSGKSSEISFTLISDKSISAESKSISSTKSNNMSEITSCKTTSLTMSDDCIVIDDECPPTVSTKQSTDISTKDNYDNSSDKRLQEPRNSENVSMSNEMCTSSSSKTISSMISDDCIIIDDETPLTDGTKQDLSTKDNYECSSSENIVKHRSFKNLGQSKLKNDICLQKSTSSKISECIIIDEITSSFSPMNETVKSAETSQPVKNGSSMVAEDKNKSAMKLENSIQNASSIKITEKPLHNCDDSSTFKPDSVPNEQVMSLLKTIDFESIKNILNGINEESSVNCDKNNSISCDIINSSNILCQVNEKVKDEGDKCTNVFETKSKCHKDSVQPKINDFPCNQETSAIKLSSRTCDSPEIIEETDNNLTSFTVSKSSLVPISNSSPGNSKSMCIKIEKDGSFVQAKDISSTVKDTRSEIKLKRKSPDLCSVESSRFGHDFQLKPYVSDISERANVNKKQKCNSIDLIPELQNAHDCKPLPETLKQEVTFESTSDELDIIATSSIETLNDDKKTSIVPLMNLYREEFKKYQEIQYTGRNLSAGLNLLHKKQLEKLKHIQTSIKNILKHDPCFHTVIREEDHKFLQSVEPVCQKDKTKLSAYSVVKETCSKNYGSSKPSTYTNAQLVFKSSRSAVSTSRNEKVNCAHCAKPAIAACQGCFKVFYCSTECGVIAWNKGHNTTCGT